MDKIREQRRRDVTFTIRTHNRKAISVVMTTLIILVASVVLGTGVVLYGTSLFQTGGQTQSISVQGLKLWVNTTYTGGSTSNPPGPIAWGAAAIRNNGDVLVSVNTIQIRGVTLPFSNWFVDANQTRVLSGTNLQAQFSYTKNDQNGNLFGTFNNGGTVSNLNPSCMQSVIRSSGSTPAYTTIKIQTDAAAVNQPLCLTQAVGPTSLQPGQAMIVYFKLPYSLMSPVDSGFAVTVSILAGSVGGPTRVTIGNP